MKQGTLKRAPKAKRTKLVPHLQEPRERRTGVQAHNTGKGPMTEKGQPTHPPMNPFMYMHESEPPDAGMAPMKELKKRPPKRKYKKV